MNGDSNGKSEKKDAFCRSCALVCEVFTNIARKVLFSVLSPAKSEEVVKKIRNLTSDQRKTASDVQKRGNYDDCDFDVAYLFIVHSFEIDQPTNGWGRLPDKCHTNIGDDIERMRIVTEYVISQQHSGLIETAKYLEITTEALEVCQRTDSRSPALKSSLFVDDLKHILTLKLDDNFREKYTYKIKLLEEKRNDLQSGREHFAQFSRVLLELNPSILQEILHAQLPIAECKRRAPKLKHLNQDQKNTIQNDIHVNGYMKCDTTLMYTLLRNLCKNKLPQPTSGWGGIVQHTDIGISDDIERIRSRRNEFGHTPIVYLETQYFKQLMQEAKDICQRMDAPSHSTFMSNAKPKFLPMLESIQKEIMDSAIQDKYIRKLDEMNVTEIHAREILDNLHEQSKRQLAELETGK